MSWAKIAVPLILLAFIGLGMVVLRPVIRGDASQPQQEAGGGQPTQDSPVGEPTPNDSVDEHQTEEESIAAELEAISDLGPMLRQVEFLEEFKASGDDPFELERSTVTAWRLTDAASLGVSFAATQRL